MSGSCCPLARELLADPHTPQATLKSQTAENAMSGKTHTSLGPSRSDDVTQALARGAEPGAETAVLIGSRSETGAGSPGIRKYLPLRPEVGSVES